MAGRRALIALSVVLVAGLGSPSVWATMANYKTFKETYPGKEPKYYSCKVCHLGAIGKKGDLNAYGLALQQSKAPGDAKQLTGADLKAVEKDDADKDGVSNGDEIKAGTYPGDSTSVPAK